MNTIEARVESRAAFTVAGLKWEGTFAEAAAGGIRAVMKEVKKNAANLSGKGNPDIQLGLSYHHEPGRFTHISGMQVHDEGQVPAGWQTVVVPAMTYAVTVHRQGTDIDQTYRMLYMWIEAQGYIRSTEGLTHLEEYPFDQDPDDDQPAFTILIPVESKESA